MIFVLVLIMACKAQASTWCGSEPIYVGADMHPTLEACEQAGKQAASQLTTDNDSYSVDFECVPFTANTRES